MGQELCLEIHSMHVPECLRKAPWGGEIKGEKIPYYRIIGSMIDKTTFLVWAELNFQKLTILRPCTFKVELGQNKVVGACSEKRWLIPN